MSLSLPVFGLFLWLSALTVVAGLPFVQPFVQPSVSAWNAQQARCEDALERRRVILEATLLPARLDWAYGVITWRLELSSTEMATAQADVDTYCR